MDPVVGTLIGTVVGLVGAYAISGRQLKAQNAEKSFQLQKDDLEQRMDILARLRHACDPTLSQDTPVDRNLNSLAQGTRNCAREAYGILVSNPWAFGRLIWPMQGSVMRLLHELDKALSERIQAAEADEVSDMRLHDTWKPLLDCLTEIYGEAVNETKILVEQRNALMEQGITTPAWCPRWKKMQPRDKVFWALFTSIAIAAAAGIWWNALK